MNGLLIAWLVAGLTPQLPLQSQQETPRQQVCPQPPASTPASTAPTVAAPTVAAPTVAAPTWSDRRQVFLKRLFGPQAILETIPGATFDTARGFPAQWPRTGAGFARRTGSQYGQFLVGETIELGVSALHREDPRYFRMPESAFGRRLRHALASTVVVRCADGTPTAGLARLANVYGSWAIATSWNPPQQRNVWKIAGNGTLGLSLKAASNVFREFWPDVKHRLHR